MPTALASAASLSEVLARLTVSVGLAHDSYAALAATHRQLGRARGDLALFMAGDHDESVSENAKGFAQNVAHALDGLDRVLTEAMKASLSVVGSKRDFGAGVLAWQEAAKEDSPST